VNKKQEFSWTYDQFQRYSVLREFLNVFYKGKKIKILDVGGVSPDREGKYLWFPVKHVFSGTSFTVDITYCKENDFIQADGCLLPLKTGSFDVVAALDVLEHIPKNKRGEFIKELCLISKSSIVVSAPFQDERIEEVEKLLSEQIKILYGVEHQQLLEHKRCGLPEIESVSQELEKYTVSGVGFYFGSLQNWLFLQTLKNCFMFRRNSGKIHNLLDKWMGAYCLSAEFKPPFSRHFWIYSKEISQENLESGLLTIKKNLKKTMHTGFLLPELKKLNKEISNFYSQESVSAVVVSSEADEALIECLNHLLTQKVDFDLEVAVWDIKGNDEAEKIIKTHFPGVSYYRQKQKQKTASGLLNVVNKLKGDYILLLSEEILLPSDSVNKFYEHLKSSHQFQLFSPKIIQKKVFYRVWLGGKNPIIKVLSKRLPNIFWRLKSDGADWIYSECLFFRREAIFERKMKYNSLSKRNIFLWEKINSEAKIIYEPEVVVYKK